MRGKFVCLIVGHTFSPSFVMHNRGPVLQHLSFWVLWALVPKGQNLNCCSPTPIGSLRGVSCWSAVYSA